MRVCPTPYGGSQARSAKPASLLSHVGRRMGRTPGGSTGKEGRNGGCVHEAKFPFSPGFVSIATDDDGGDIRVPLSRGMSPKREIIVNVGSPSCLN